jgi:hypothetical protein
MTTTMIITRIIMIPGLLGRGGGALLDIMMVMMVIMKIIGVFPPSPAGGALLVAVKNAWVVHHVVACRGGRTIGDISTMVVRGIVLHVGNFVINVV